jgi:hypothetical protein
VNLGALLNSTNYLLADDVDTLGIPCNDLDQKATMVTLLLGEPGSFQTVFSNIYPDHKRHFVHDEISIWIAPQTEQPAYSVMRRGIRRSFTHHPGAAARCSLIFWRGSAASGSVDSKTAIMRIRPISRGILMHF